MRQARKPRPQLGDVDLCVQLSFMRRGSEGKLLSPQNYRLPRVLAQCIIQSATEAKKQKLRKRDFSKRAPTMYYWSRTAASIYAKISAGSSSQRWMRLLNSFRMFAQHISDQF